MHVCNCLKTWVKRLIFREFRTYQSNFHGRDKVAKELLLPKAPDPDGFNGELNQTVTEWIIPALSDTQGIEGRQISSYFYEENNTLIPKSDRH